MTDLVLAVGTAAFSPGQQSVDTLQTESVSAHLEGHVDVALLADGAGHDSLH